MTKDELEQKANEFIKGIEQEMGMCMNEFSRPSVVEKLTKFASKMTEDLEKELEMLAEQYPDLKQSLDWANEREKELLEQIEKMKCCENCKYSSSWGDEVHCNHGLKEAVLEDKLVECHDMDKWELKE